MVVDKLNKPVWKLWFKRVYFQKVLIVVETPKCNAELAETYGFDATKCGVFYALALP